MVEPNAELEDALAATRRSLDLRAKVAGGRHTTDLFPAHQFNTYMRDDLAAWLHDHQARHRVGEETEGMTRMLTRVLRESPSYQAWLAAQPAERVAALKAGRAA